MKWVTGLGNTYGAPALADWDGNLIVGAADGTVHYLERSAHRTRFVPRTGETNPFLAIRAANPRNPRHLDSIEGRRNSVSYISGL